MNNLYDLIEESPNPIFRVSLDGIILFGNAACKPLFEHCGCHVGGECPPMIIEDTDKAREEEIKINNATYLLQINPHVEKGYVSVYAHNITNQKRAEKTLLESESRYKMLVEEASDIIYRANAKGEFTYLNPMAKKILKVDDEDIKGMHVSLPVRTDWKDRVVKFYMEQLSSEETMSYYEFPILDSEGNEIWLGQNVKVLKTDGKVQGFHSVARDITDRIKMEKSLKEAKEKAELSLKTQEMFLANMSHEIRTPLNGILGMSKLLTNAELSPKDENYLGSIRKSAKHLLTIINDLLDLSKIESGKMELESTGLKISDIVNNVLNIAQYSTAEKNLYLINEMDDSLADKVYLGDPVRISQVLTNIVGNAVKFTEEGEVRIITKLVSESYSKKRVLFMVKDTGIGIPEDKLQTVFESFKQADNDTTRKYGGTGLGLTICKQLVTLMDGEIDLQSELGVGTTFSIELPFEEGGLEDLQELQATNPNYDLTGLNVLLVEDNPVNQIYATTILEGENASVELADNGLIAIDKVLSNEFDIILMDGQMPEMGGMEATTIIRKKLKVKTPIIALTANAFKGERNKYLEAGMNEYIPKPYESTELLNAIGMVLSLKEKTDVKVSVPETDTICKNTKSLDLTKLKTFSCGNDEFVSQMISLFKQEVPKSLEGLTKALQEEDYGEIRSFAHDMKSSIDLMGLDILEELQEIEKLASQKKDLNRIAQIVPIVLSSCNDALMDLQSM